MGTVKNSSTNAPIATYKWLANGTKAGAVNGNGTFGMEYLGSLVYRRNAAGDLTIDSTAFGGGRILAAETGTGYDYTPNYFITDHLGSTRAIVELTAGSTVNVTERSDFYPFGARHINPAAATTDNRYRFSGKEDQESIGLHFQDFGARMYDPYIGRWWSIDPLAKKYYSISPYVYCLNNPLLYIDLDGNEPKKTRISVTLKGSAGPQVGAKIKIGALSIGGSLRAYNAEGQSSLSLSHTMGEGWSFDGSYVSRDIYYKLGGGIDSPLLPFKSIEKERSKDPADHPAFTETIKTTQEGLVETVTTDTYEGGDEVQKKQENTVIKFGVEVNAFVIGSGFEIRIEDVGEEKKKKEQSRDDY